MNMTFKEDKEIVQEGSKAPGMVNSKDAQIPMKETKPQKLKMTPNFIIRVNSSTSLLEMKVELLNNTFSSQKDYKFHAPRG